jgi:hypothetical protein
VSCTNAVTKLEKFERSKLAKEETIFFSMKSGKINMGVM